MSVDQYINSTLFPIAPFDPIKVPIEEPVSPDIFQNTDYHSSMREIQNLFSQAPDKRNKTGTDFFSDRQKLKSRGAIRDAH